MGSLSQVQLIFEYGFMINQVTGQASFGSGGRNTHGDDFVPCRSLGSNLTNGTVINSRLMIIASAHTESWETGVQTIALTSQLYCLYSQFP